MPNDGRSPVGAVHMLKGFELHAPVTDGEVRGFQTRFWVFESPPECHVRDAEVVEALVCKTSLSGFESRRALQSYGR